MRTWITHLTTLRTPYAEDIEGQQAQRLLLINLMWLVLTVLAVPVVVWRMIEDGPDTVTLFIPVSLLPAIAIHRDLQNGVLNRARWLFVLNIGAISLLANFPEYRLDSPFIIMLTLPVTAAGALLKRIELLGFAMLLVVIVTMGGLVQIRAEMEPTPLGDLTASIRTTVFVFAVTVTLTTAMLWLFLTNTEEALQQRRSLAALLAVTESITEKLAELPAPGEALNQAIEQLRSTFDLYHVQVFLINPASGLALLKASTGYLGRRLLEEESLSTPDEDSPINDALRRKTPLVILDSDPENQRAGFLPATQSQVLIPLRVKDYLPFGVLDLHSTERRTFTPELMNALTIIGNQLAAALYGVQQTDDLRTSFEERDKLLDQIENNRRDLAKINRQIVGSAWGMYLTEREGAVPGYDWRNHTIVTAQTESPILNQTLGDGQAHLEHGDGFDILCVPIRLRGQVLGAVEFRRANEQEKWSGAVLDLAQATAERLALSLENARLFEQAQSTAQREQLVSQITSDLQANHELRALLNQAAAQFQQALGATHTRVRLGLADDTHLGDDQA
jgi:GAF domain-containing protein